MSTFAWISPVINPTVLGAVFSVMKVILLGFLPFIGGGNYYLLVLIAIHV